MIFWFGGLFVRCLLRAKYLVGTLTSQFTSPFFNARPPQSEKKDIDIALIVISQAISPFAKPDAIVFLTPSQHAQQNRITMYEVYEAQTTEAPEVSIRYVSECNLVIDKALLRCIDEKLAFYTATRTNLSVPNT